MLHAGFNAVDITPELPAWLTGFAARKSPALEVGAPLYARILALRWQRQKALLVVCDLLGFSLDDAMNLERQMARATGVAPHRVILACTHTHSGPRSLSLGLVGQRDAAYLSQLEQKLKTGAKAATADLQPVDESCLGTPADIAELGEFRCVLDGARADGWPGRLRSLCLNRRNAPPIFLAHVGIHPYVLGWRNLRVHPDYPGMACAAMEQKLGGHALMLPGCGADISPRPGMTHSLKTVAKFGKKLADAAGKSLSQGRKISVAPLSVASARPRLRYGYIPAPAVASNEDDTAAMRALASAGKRFSDNRKEWEQELKNQKLPRSVPFPLRALRLGELTLTAMPAELFFDTGEALSQAFPKREIWTLSQAGGNAGYLPVAFAYPAETYEVAAAFEWYRTFGAPLPTAEPRLRQTLARLIKRTG